MENQNELKRITMNVIHVNPDAQVKFISIGTGNTKKEASVFALAIFYKIMNEENDYPQIDNYNVALSIVTEYLPENWNTVIDLLSEGKLENNSDAFFNSYESTKVDYNWTEINNVSVGGYIEKIEVIEHEY
jgi:hypothetical protein